MTINDSKILDQIVSININRRSFAIDDLKAHSVIAISSGFQYNIGTTVAPEWKTIAELNALSFKVGDMPLTLDTKTFIVYRSLDLTKVKFTISPSTDASLKLTNFIKYYFLEGGENLHMREVSSVAGENILNAKIVYTVAIQLCLDTEMVVLLSDNNERNLHSIVDEVSTVISSERIFKMNTYGNFFYLSHVTSYLENLTLDYEMKDYNYTKTSSILPSTENDIVVGKENVLVNIGGEGVSIGGELINGENLVQSYILQLLENSLKNTLFNELTNKPNRAQATTILYNAISNVLDNFYSKGALESKVFSNPTYKIIYNNIDYTVIEKGEYLDKGYHIFIVDINNSSQEDLDAKRMTPISIILLMANQIRFIKLDMEVF